MSKVTRVGPKPSPPGRRGGGCSRFEGGVRGSVGIHSTEGTVVCREDRFWGGCHRASANGQAKRWGKGRASKRAAVDKRDTNLAVRTRGPAFRGGKKRGVESLRRTT